MLNKIRQLFAKNTDISEQDQIATEHLATAALLIEVMIIDGNLDDQELQSISQTLCEILDLTEALCLVLQNQLVFRQEHFKFLKMD